MIGCLTETTICVMAKPLVHITELTCSWRYYDYEWLMTILLGIGLLRGTTKTFYNYFKIYKNFKVLLYQWFDFYLTTKLFLKAV